MGWLGAAYIIFFFSPIGIDDGDLFAEDGNLIGSDFGSIAIGSGDFTFFNTAVVPNINF